MTSLLNRTARIEFFKTYEAREQAFNRAVGELVPVRYQGPRVFWRDFQQIIQSQVAPVGDLPAFITSNPRDCLAFGSAAQVLAAARMTAGGPIDSSEDMAVKFDIQHIMDQPIRTLSGGETVRVALAKAMIMAAGCDQLVVSSPFCWMSANHLPHLDRVVAHYENKGKKVRILAMNEETSTAPMSADLPRRMVLGEYGFTIICQGLRIYLETTLNAITSQPGLAMVTDASLDLRSPCLLVGDNGQGKSLLAKALCGAVSIQGRAAVTAPSGGEGRAGLLFQDVVVQTLMRTVRIMEQGAGKHTDPSAGSIFIDILARYRHWLPHTQNAPEPTMAAGTPDDSLLAVKTMLIAIRLAHRPPALILDEPDWGLCRAAALALVPAVVEKAHSLGVAVIIISHKPWWHTLAADRVVVVKTPAKDPAGRFVIHLQKMKPA